MSTTEKTESATANDEPALNEVASNQPATASSAVNMLRIVSGLHAGADRMLGTQEMILIGSGDDCDIVLADAGIARHHAMVMLFDGVASVRALDAPLRVDGRTLHPGDPIVLSAGQGIELGGAILAVGDADDIEWSGMLGEGETAADAAKSRRLPMIAALAAMSLASVAIFAAVVPASDPAPTAQQRLNTLIGEYRITDGLAAVDADGVPVLSGTVRDTAARQLIEQRLQAEGIAAKIDLRTGDDIANDVREVLRTQGLAARTRYLGNGDVEVSGRFEDEEALRAAAQSRAMIDVTGVKRVIPRNYAPTPAQTPAPAQQKATAHIVAVVRGQNPYVLASDGSKYMLGAELPGGAGSLVGIGEHAWALSAGEIRRVKLQPTQLPAGSFANVKAAYVRLSP